MTKNHAHYYSRQCSPRKGKKNNNFPGQLRFNLDGNLDQDLLALIEEKPVETTSQPKQERTCTPEASKAYWESFKEFLDASGVFARTWNLYKQIKIDPSVKELDAQLNDMNLSPDKKEQIKEIKEGVVRREIAMRQKMQCDTPEEVFVKAHNDWNRFKSKFNTLIEKASKADVSLALSTEEKREWMLNFVLLDDAHLGSKRRNFYKDKYVERALKSLEKTGYAEPISMIDIEKEYKTWLVKCAKRKHT